MSKQTHSKTPKAAPVVAPITTITNRLGIPPVTPADIANIAATVAAAVAAVKSACSQVPGLILLDAEVKPYIIKTRKGCEPFIGDMVTGMKEFPAFAPENADPVGLANTLLYLQALAPLQQAVTGINNLVGDTILAQQGAAWRASLEAYSAFQFALPNHPELAAVVAPMQAFMALPSLRKPKVKKVKAPKAGGKTAGAAASGGSGGSTAGTTPPVPVFTPSGEEQ